MAIPAPEACPTGGTEPGLQTVWQFHLAEHTGNINFGSKSEYLGDNYMMCLGWMTGEDLAMHEFLQNSA
jgi:hypothetical protein